MNKFLEQRFKLTPEGAATMKRAIFLYILDLIACMLPVVLVMSVAWFAFMGQSISVSSILICTALILAFLIITKMKSYDAFYTATYSECEALRTNICKDVKDLPMSYYTSHDYTDISQTITEDLSLLEQAYSHAIPQLIGLLPFLGAVIILLILSDFYMGLVIGIPIIICFIIAAISKNIQLGAASTFYSTLRDNSAAIQEAVDMQKEIRSYNLEDKTRTDLFGRMEESEHIHFKTEMTLGLFLTLPWMILDLMPGLAILVGAYLYTQDQLSAIYVIGYVLAAYQISNVTKGLFNYIAMIFTIDARLAKITEIRDSAACAIESVGTQTISGHDICFNKVSFSYTPENKILDRLDFTAKSGEVTALVGPSGCGKTTVLRLIAHLYDANSGTITIGDRDICSVKPTDLYDNLSIVFQDVCLFNSSVFDNIAIGKQDATKEEVFEAASLANCDEFIKDLPEGFDTLIGEDGCELSGGQRQRISIARALLKDAPIIILDEIASNLDIENEHQVENSLRTLIKDKTTIVISHRMKSIQNADKILVLDKGKLVGEGSHEKLLETCEVYRQMIDKTTLTEEFKY